MINRAIVDTGPLVAMLDSDERHHKWCLDQLQTLAPPLLVCESVLAECCFLLQRFPNAQSRLFEMLERGSLQIAFSLAEHASDVGLLLLKYSDRPASLADASLIKMSELNPDHFVFTLDSDFHYYRRHRRKPIPLIVPS